MHLEPGTYNLDDMDEGKMEGNYAIQTIRNEAEPDYSNEIYLNLNILNQAVYYIGNVLVRTDTENVEELIKLFIRYTHDECKDVDLDFSTKSVIQMKFGTICPMKSVLFVYKSKIFVGYGRYIFGCTDHVIFRCTEREREFTLDRPKYDKKGGDEYVYAFMIYDQHTNVIDAFGLYR